MFADDYYFDAVEGAVSNVDGFAIESPVVLAQKNGGDGPIRVLVLEDDALQLELLIDHLQSVGLVAIGVATVAQARQQLNDTKFNLAIFDIQLPDGSGLDLCNCVADDSRFCSMPTIVLSSMNEANMVRQTRAAGASFFIGKPYDPNVLLTIIERALGTELQ
jgi:DNA-binding response OmpR family regulator